MSQTLIEAVQKTIVELKYLAEKKTLWKSKRTRNILKLRTKQLNHLLDLLEQEDAEFNTLWNRNMDLLVGEDLLFSASMTNRNVISGHPSFLTGKMDNNGNLVADGTGRNIPKMTKYAYPKFYSGKIDALGRINLRATNKGLGFMLFVLPKNYIGYIEANGKVVMKMWKENSVTFKSTTISRLTCNPFGKNSEYKNEFLQNKDKIMRKAALRLAFIERLIL
ncbi:MAG: hypothetical protein ACI8ZM_003445 [Crocinitomix sp.]|jgi:hypothetical protein